MPRFKKGSKEAKDYMAKLRAKVGKGKKKRKTYMSAKRHKSTVKPMARRRKSYRKKSYRRKDKRLPLLPLIGLAQNFITPAPSGRTIIDDVKNGDFNGLVYDMKEKFTGIDNTGKFRVDWLIGTYMPIVAGGIGSKIATKMGVNRTLKKVPFVGNYIKL